MRKLKIYEILDNGEKFYFADYSKGEALETYGDWCGSKPDDIIEINVEEWNEYVVLDSDNYDPYYTFNKFMKNITEPTFITESV